MLRPLHPTGSLSPTKAVSRSDDDLRLVDQILGGDVRAFEELVRRHERRVFRVALAVTGNQQDAEDAMQETFIKLYRRISDFRRESRFTTWLTSIALNEALQLRRLRKQSDSFEELDDASADLPAAQRKQEWYANPEQRYARREIRGFVEEAVLSLEPQYRVVFVLRDIEGLSTDEACEVLDLGAAALKSRLLRARLMVREKLAAKFEKRPGLRARFVRVGLMLRQSLADRLGGASHNHGEQ
jgi:RNA polymerase sigma-70 factor, ECF subfamily